MVDTSRRGALVLLLAVLGGAGLPPSTAGAEPQPSSAATCLLSQLKVSTIAFDLSNAAGRHVHFELTGTVLRLGPPGVVFGHDRVTGVPVTAEVTSQTDQSCSGPVSSVHASLVRALGVGPPEGIVPGD